MLNNWKGREDSTAVSVKSEKILHYWAEPAEESESKDSSPLSLGARSVTANYCDRFFFFFFFFLNNMHLFKVQRRHSALTLWPTKTITSSPQETSKPPSPSCMRPTAHLAYCPTKSYEHTRTPEGSRKERSKQEGEENPSRDLLQKV